MLFLWLVLGSRSRFTKLRGPLIAGDAPDANDMIATSQRWRHSKGRPAYHCLVRECTRLTGFDVQDRSRGAPCAGPRQLVRHPITGAWLLDDAAQPVWRILLEHCCSCVGIDISRSTKESNHHPPHHHESATAQRTLTKKRSLGPRCSRGVI